MDVLVIEPLTKQAFEPFGEVIEREGARSRLINGGTTDRLHALATTDVSDEGGWAIVSIFRGRRRPFPLTISMMERHPLGSQAFFPLQPFDWLVVVGTPAERLRCFRASGRQGVSYDKDVWHHPLLILQPEQDFLVVDREGPGVNLEELVYPTPIARIEM
jgi:ureidoglycolate lyase